MSPGRGPGSDSNSRYRCWSRTHDPPGEGVLRRPDNARWASDLGDERISITRSVMGPPHRELADKLAGPGDRGRVAGPGNWAETPGGTGVPGRVQFKPGQTGSVTYRSPGRWTDCRRRGQRPSDGLGTLRSTDLSRGVGSFPEASGNLRATWRPLEKPRLKDART